MNIHEYQAKEILHKFSVPVPKGFVTMSAEGVKTQVSQLKSDVFVVKAQIHAGGRGKAGGVKLAKSERRSSTVCKRHDWYDFSYSSNRAKRAASKKSIH